MNQQREKPSAVAGITAEGFANKQNNFQAQPTTRANSQSTKITNRPFITRPSKPCPKCGRAFVAAWGWLFLPDGRVIDPCGECARLLRYSNVEARCALLSALWTRYSAERRAAA